MVFALLLLFQGAHASLCGKALETKALAHALPEGAREVYALAALKVHTVVQTHGTCYIDSVLGAIQDQILTQQRKERVFLNDELVLSRFAPMARFLSARLEEFLNSPEETKTEKRAAQLICGGSILYSVGLLANIDIPLFKFSRRDNYSGVSKLIAQIHADLSFMVARNFDDAEIRKAIRSYLSNAIQQEFDNAFNAGIYYHLDSVELDPRKDTRPMGVQLKELVDRNVPTIVLYNVSDEYTKDVNHGARVAGYLLDADNEVVGILITDTRRFYDERGDAISNLKMSLKEFEARGGQLHPLKISGELIPRVKAKTTPLF